jgi:hypothetical protein
MAARFGSGAPRDDASLAPSRIEIVLVAKIAIRSTTDSPTDSGSDSPDREGESHV